MKTKHLLVISVILNLFLMGFVVGQAVDRRPRGPRHHLRKAFERIVAKKDLRPLRKKMRNSIHDLADALNEKEPNKADVQKAFKNVITATENFHKEIEKGISKIK